MNTATTSNAEYIYYFTANARDGIAIDSDGNIIGPETMMSRYGVDARTLCLGCLARDRDRNLPILPRLVPHDPMALIEFAAATGAERDEIKRLRAYLAACDDKRKRVDAAEIAAKAVDDEVADNADESDPIWQLANKLVARWENLRLQPIDIDIRDLFDTAAERVTAGIGGPIKVARLADDMAGDYGR